MSSLHSKTSTKPSSIPLHRRLLFPDLPPSAPVPPILRNASTELNTELYELIALALRSYITPWWSKITRYDTEFVPHVATVICAVVRAIAARLEQADVETLVLRAAPIVVAQHYTDYRAAVAKLGSAYANGGTASLAQLFHQHQNHMGIAAEGHIDQTYGRHLIDLILHESLPVEDQESDAERAIIREVMVKVVMEDIIPLLNQPWFIYKLMLDQLRFGQEGNAVPMKAAEFPESRSSNPAFHSMVIFILSMVQYLSGMCLMLIQWYKQAVVTVKCVNGAPDLAKSKQPERGFASNLLCCTSEILDARSRMAASVVFDNLESLVKLFEDFADRLLVYMLRTYVMTEQQVITIARLSKQTLFPNGYPGPPTIIPPSEEQVLIKEQLVREIELRIPSLFSSLVFGPGSRSRETIAQALEPLSSEACNTHLILFLLDLIVLTLFPEFGVERSAENERNGTTGSPKVDSSVSPSPSPEPERSTRETSPVERGRSDVVNGR